MSKDRVMNNSGDLFLRCNNLTLDQYKLIVLSRGLTGAVGFTVSLVVLVVILLAARRRSWNTLSKRLFFVTILYNSVYSVVVATGIHYDRPPDQESTWCDAMGFLLQCSGFHLIVSYIVLAIALALQVVMPVCPALHTRVKRTCKGRKSWEVILLLASFLFPVLINLEPFIALTDPYGNYGPVCWFRLEIDEKCAYKPLSKDDYFIMILQYPLPFMAFLLLPLVVITTLCCIYCKFHSTRMDSYLKKAIGQTVILTVASITICVAWISLFLLRSVKNNTNFSSWTEDVTITPITVMCGVVLMALYIHIPAQLLYNCCKRSIRTRLRSLITEKPTVRSSQWDHRNVPSFTETHIYAMKQSLVQKQVN